MSEFSGSKLRPVSLASTGHNKSPEQNISHTFQHLRPPQIARSARLPAKLWAYVNTSADRRQSGERTTVNRRQDGSRKSRRRAQQLPSRPYPLERILGAALR